MNIAILTPSKNPYSETFIQAHKNYLKGNVFYYYGSADNIKLENKESLIPYLKLKWLILNAKLFKKPSSYIREQKLHYSLKKNKIDVILVEYGVHAYNLLNVLRVANIPFVVHFHGFDASVTKVVKRCKNYKTVFNVASKIIAVSKEMEQTLLKLGCPKNKLVYNVYGPHPEFEKIRPNFSKKQFCAIGRFTDKKAPYYSILAFKDVVKKYPDAKLVMAGDGDLLNMCKNLVKHYNLEANIKLLGVITPDTFRSLLTESLAFVQHSIRAEDGDMEGTPLSVLEASSAGLPVISTFHAGIPDVILDKKTGLLCAEHDVNKMTYNMLQLLDDVNYAKQLGEAGKSYVNKNFSLNRHINILNDIFFEIAHHNKI